jgi:hypothetical protein
MKAAFWIFILILAGLFFIYYKGSTSVLSTGGNVFVNGIKALQLRGQQYPNPNP